MEQTKLMSTAKKLGVFFKVMQRLTLVCMIVAVAVVAVLSIVNAVNPEAVIGTGFNMVDIGPISLELAEELAPGNCTILLMSWAYIAAAVLTGGVAYYAFGCLRRILSPMEQGNPFDLRVAAELKKLGWCSLAAGIAYNLVEIIGSSAVLHIYGLLEMLRDSGHIRNITVNYSFDLSFLVLFFLLLLMSYIFRYGAELQKLSDETV